MSLGKVQQMLMPIILDRIDKAIDVLLRIPSLFIVDNYWKNAFTDRTAKQNDWNLFVFNLALLNGFLILLLPLNHLKRYYLHLTAWLLFMSSFNLSQKLFSNDLQNCILFPSLQLFLKNEKIPPLFSSQNEKFFNFSIFTLHITFNFIILIFFHVSSKYLISGFIGSALLTTVYVVEFSQNLSQISIYAFCAIFCMSFTSYSCIYLPIFITEVKKLLKTTISIGKNEGFSFLWLETFKKIFVPVHFLLFWIITFVFKLSLQLWSTYSDNNNWYYLILSSVSGISPISLLSTAITVTYISFFLLSLIKFYLWGTVPNLTDNFVNINPTRDHNGWEEGMTTLLLTTITALTDMNESARLAVLIIISFVVLSSLLQSMLEISEPAILSLNINHNSNRIHHLKILLLCAFLFCFPLYVTYIVSQIFPVNFWIAVVFSTSLLISARVLDLVIVHCLFWWDSCQKEPWEYLDEVVYFARSFTKILEFIISISVVIVGLWEAANKRSNLINSSILILHCYFNVWQRINDGLRSYFQRREANRIVKSLMFADLTTISEYNDLCSICFLEMTEENNLLVVVTRCNHLFHRLCIKKWLCIQNRCPLCTCAISVLTDDEVK